jgi:oxygen-dependent protoporphyrinogen oxidase
MFHRRRVAVVGAGPAGLAAAIALSQRGISVKVYEKLCVPGGRSGCDLIGGIRFDRGADFVASFYPRTLRIIRDHGLGEQLLPVHLDGDVLFDGLRLPLPLRSWLLFKSPLLSWRTKLALISLGPQLLSWRLRYRWTSMEQAAAKDDRSAPDYFRARLGEDYARVILGPTLESFLISPAGETSRVVAMVQAHEAIGARFYCVRGGMATLREAVAARYSVEYGASFARVVPDDPGVRIELSRGTEWANAAIIAIPGPEAAALLPEDHVERSIADQSRYSAVVKLHASLAWAQPGIRPVCLGQLGHTSLAGVGVEFGRQPPYMPQAPATGRVVLGLVQSRWTPMDQDQAGRYDLRPTGRVRCRRRQLCRRDAVFRSRIEVRWLQDP